VEQEDHLVIMVEADPLAGMTPVDHLMVMVLEEATAAAVTVMMRMNKDTEEYDMEENDTESPSNSNPQRSSTPQAEHPSRSGCSR
jgi:hypothetical protein